MRMGPAFSPCLSGPAAVGGQGEIAVAGPLQALLGVFDRDGADHGRVRGGVAVEQGREGDVRRIRPRAYAHEAHGDAGAGGIADVPAIAPVNLDIGMEAWWPTTADLSFITAVVSSQACSSPRKAAPAGSAGCHRSLSVKPSRQRPEPVSAGTPRFGQARAVRAWPNADSRSAPNDQKMVVENATKR